MRSHFVAIIQIAEILSRGLAPLMTLHGTRNQSMVNMVPRIQSTMCVGMMDAAKWRNLRNGLDRTTFVLT